MRRFLAIALLLLPAACKQIDELPPVTAKDAPVGTGAAAAPAEARPPVWLAAEAPVFEHVQKVLEDAGFPEVRTAVFAVSEEVPLPTYQRANRTLTIPSFTDGAEPLRARIARMSARHFGGTLTFLDAFESTEKAYRAYQAFLTVAVAHELAHHIQGLRKGADSASAQDIYDLEAEAIEFEQAFLAHEIEAKHVPEAWRGSYRRSVMAIRDSIPKAAFAALPEDDKALRAAFARAYITYSNGEAAAMENGVNVETAAASTVYAGYTQRRIALLAKGGRSLEVLAKAEAERKKAAP
jgi:hypothetical protein